MGNSMVTTGLGETAAIPSSLQLEVLGYLVRDRKTFSHFVSVIEKEHFENPVHRVIYGIAKKYFIRYMKPCPREILERELGNFLRRARRKQVVPPEYFWREVEKIYRVSLVERQYLIDKVTEYMIRAQLAEVGEMAISEATREGDVEMANVAGAVNKLFGMIAGGVVGAKKEYLLADAGARIRENPILAKIGTGLRALDRVLGGGLGDGELGIVMSPTGYGKSFFLNTVGTFALYAQKKVIHVTLELSCQKALRRYESLITKQTKHELFAHSDRAARKLARARRLTAPADVRVEERPTRGLTVDELRALITQVSVGEGFEPDMLVVDYADIMRPTPYSKDEKGYEMLATIYERLRGLAQEFDIPIWTGSQATRKSMGHEIITVADIAGAFAKAQIADVVIAICRTTQELRASKGRFFVGKNRDNPAYKVIPFEEDFDRARFWEEPEAEETEATPENEVYEGEPRRVIEQ